MEFFRNKKLTNFYQKCKLYGRVHKIQVLVSIPIYCDHCSTCPEPTIITSPGQENGSGEGEGVTVPSSEWK